MELTRQFNESDFRFLKSITIEELADTNYISQMVNFITRLDKKASGGKIVVRDLNNAQNTDVYSYAKFVEIYDKFGADGFIKY